MMLILTIFFFIGVYAFGLRWLLGVIFWSCVICFLLYLSGTTQPWH